MPVLKLIKNYLLLSICLVILSQKLIGCASDSNNGDITLPITIIHNKKDITELNKYQFSKNPVPGDFPVCHGHTCNNLVNVELTPDEWKSVRYIFSDKSGSAEAERDKIKDAIAMMEQVVGKKTGTSLDKGENFSGIGMPGQMDCVDESTNTTVYLTMFQNDGLLDWHNVTYRESRGIFSLQAPHFTAVIQQKDNNRKFVVDSWFLDNGEKPFILPLKEWKRGWHPQRGGLSQ